MINGRFVRALDVEIDDYTRYATSVTSESVDAMFNSVGDHADIKSITLVGGGSRFYLPTIKAKYSKHDIITTNNSVCANVVGFQMACERTYLKVQVQARKPL